MMRRKRPALPPTVKWLRVYDDASGCEATIEVNGYTFAGSCLGAPSVRYIGPEVGSRIDSEAAYKQAVIDYNAVLAAAVSEEWRERNRAMYASSTAMPAKKRGV